MSTNTALHVSLIEAEKLVMIALGARLVANLLSSPGIGKSSLARQIAEKNNLKLIDVRLSQLDPADMNGFPFLINTSEVDKIRAGYVPMNIFPIASDPLPLDANGKPMAGWLLLLDEFNSGSLNVQAAAYKIVLDKMVGMHRLHNNVAIMTAGNLSTDKALVNRLNTAMQSRIVTLTIRVDETAWRIWADKNNIDHRVKSFLSWKVELLHKFDPNHNDVTFPCPRTWEFLSRLIKNHTEISGDLIPLLAGTVGEGAAREFFSYCQVFRTLCTFDQIIANPEHIQFGTDPSVHYALSGLVAHKMNKNNADTVMKFIARLGIDFQVITLRAAIAKDYTIKSSKAVNKWIEKNADELLG